MHPTIHYSILIELLCTELALIVLLLLALSNTKQYKEKGQNSVGLLSVSQAVFYGKYYNIALEVFLKMFAKILGMISFLFSKP